MELSESIALKLVQGRITKLVRTTKLFCQKFSRLCRSVSPKDTVDHWHDARRESIANTFFTVIFAFTVPNSGLLTFVNNNNNNNNNNNYSNIYPG